MVAQKERDAHGASRRGSGSGWAAATCTSSIPLPRRASGARMKRFPSLRLARGRDVPTITDMRPDPHATAAGRFLYEEIEVLRADLPRGRFRSVLFDFDGTLSLIREGWPEVMIPMMVDVLRETGTAEDTATLTAAVEEFVMRLNGRQTIYQMIQLADEVHKRGGTPLEPLAYKHRYHALLMERIQGRIDALASGTAPADDWTVPGSRELLDSLRR